MRVHHLNCGTLRPFGGRRVNGDRPPFLPARMVCHCLLVEAGERLVLVDTGFGLADLARLRRPWSPLRRPRVDAPEDGLRRRLSRYGYAKLGTRPRLHPRETAVHQVRALGHDPAEVSDVVLTHLDLDHAGGLPDFPRARVHVHRVEHKAAMAAARPGAGERDRLRYWPYQWAHGPRWVTYVGGERWLGFDGVRALEGLPEVAFVPLPGHTVGHCGVAIHRGGEVPWLLHAGDAYFDHREVAPDRPHSTPGLAGFQKRMEADGTARRESRQRLRDLAAAHAGEVELFCSHDPVELERYREDRGRGV